MSANDDIAALTLTVPDRQKLRKMSAIHYCNKTNKHQTQLCQLKLNTATCYLYAAVYTVAYNVGRCLTSKSCFSTVHFDICMKDGLNGVCLDWFSMWLYSTEVEYIDVAVFD